MKVWVTKYALTRGIFQAEGERWKNFFDARGEGFLNSNEWRETKEGAIACAEHMRLDKIASLRSQIDRLEKLKFMVEEPS